MSHARLMREAASITAAQLPADHTGPPRSRLERGIALAARAVAIDPRAAPLLTRLAAELERGDAHSFHHKRV